MYLSIDDPSLADLSLGNQLLYDAIDEAMHTLTPPEEVTIRAQFGFEPCPEFEDVKPSGDWRSAVQKLRVNAYAVLSPWSPDV